MFSFFRSVLSRKEAVPSTRIVRDAKGVVYENGIEVPQSPPYAQGIEVVSREALLETQRELIEKIYGALSFSRAEFDLLALPIIERYAGWVHLLPASEAHHHKTAGGLFRHGLEVAFYAAQGSRGIIFGIGSTPTERRNNEPRWRLAAMCAGLLHDIGKPVTDVIVTDGTRGIRWHPHMGMLNEWASTNNVSRYYLRWTDKRHKLHESSAAPILGSIMTPAVMNYFYEGGAEIYPALADAICGLSAVKPLAKLMIESDQSSVALDLRENRISATDQDYGLPVERFIFDAIRSLINSGQWTTNIVGSRVWHFKDHGVFIALRQGAAELYETTQKTLVPGIPREADTIADILIERGHAIAKPVPGSSATDRYWQFKTSVISEDGLSSNITLVLLKLESATLIYATEPPAAIQGELEDSYLKSAATTVKKSAAKKTTAVNAKALEQQIIEEQTAASKRPMDFESLMSELQRSEATNPDAEEDTNETSSEVPLVQSCPPEETSAVIAQETHKEAVVESVESNTPAVEDESQLALTLSNVPSEQSQTSAPVESQPLSDDCKPSAHDNLEKIISTYADEVQIILKNIIGSVLTREAPLGVTLSRISDDLHEIGIPYPNGIEAAFPDDPATKSLEILARAGVIVPDPDFPAKNVHTIHRDKYLIFNASFESAVLASLADIEESAAPLGVADLLGLVPAPLAAKRNTTKKQTKPVSSEPDDKLLPTSEVLDVVPPALVNVPSKLERSIDEQPFECNTSTNLTGTAESRIDDGFADACAYDDSYFRDSENQYEENIAPPCELDEAVEQQKMADAEYKAILIQESLIESSIKPSEIEVELRKQVMQGSGPWIVGDVSIIPKGREISADSLKIIEVKYAGILKKTDIKHALLNQGWTVSRRFLTLHENA